MRVHFGLEWISVIMFIAFYKHATGTYALNEDLWLEQYVANKAQSLNHQSADQYRRQRALSPNDHSPFCQWALQHRHLLSQWRDKFDQKCFYSFSCQLYSKLQCGLRTWPTLYSSLCEAWCIYAWAEYWQHAFMVIFLWLNVNVHGVGCRRESSKKDSDVRLRSIITIKNISAWILLAPDWLKPLLGMIKYSCLNSIFESVCTWMGLKHRTLA